MNALKTSIMLLVKLFMDHYGDRAILILLILSGVYLFAEAEDIRKKILFPTIVTCILIFNPLFQRYLSGRTVYWRMIWVIPETMIIAFAFVKMLQKIHKRLAMLVMAAFLMLVVMFFGTNVYHAAGFSKNEMSVKAMCYKINPAVIHIADAMLKYDDKPGCIVPQDLYTELRQYNGNIEMAYGRDMESYIETKTGEDDAVYEQMESLTPDYSIVCDAAVYCNYDFIVTYADRPINEKLISKYNYKEIAKTDGKIIYYNSDVKDGREEGKITPGWKKNPAGIQQYVNKSGKKVTGKQKIDGKWYYFNRYGNLVPQVTEKEVMTLSEGDLILTQFGDDGSDRTSMFYTIDDQKGHFYIVDGGTAHYDDQLRKEIAEYGNKVTGWILTHPHEDHIGAFNDIYANPEGIEIKHIYAIDIDGEYYHKVANSWDQVGYFDTFNSLAKNMKNLTYVKRGETYDIEGLKIKVLNTFNKDSYTIKTGSLPNAASMVFKVYGKKSSFLFLGDVEDENASNMIRDYSKDINSDYVEVSHHGENLSDDFYDKVDAEVAFFDCPEFMRNDDSKFKVSKHINYFKEKGVEIKTWKSSPNVLIMK